MALSRTLRSLYPWVSSPLIVGAPMRVMSGPALAVAISNAGGLGLIGPNPKTQDTLSDLEEASNLIRKAGKLASSPFHSLPSEYSLLPVGVAFVLWNDDLEIAVSAIAKYNPCAAWLYAPRDGQKDFDVWSRRIRLSSPNTQIWIQIGTVTEVRQLLQSPERPDVIVIQGAEAGGHGRATDAMGLITLLPEVADTLRGSGITLCAAGGIADGRGAASALCLGASAVAMGTRFLTAEEARISKGYQQEVVRASDGAISTTRTLLYNQLRGTTGWPKEFIPRGIINRSWIEYQAGTPFEELKRRHDEALKAGDSGWGPDGRLATYAGAAVGLIHDVKPASEIVRDTREGALQTLKDSEIAVR
ncbi:hypothetical protein V1525DRAFT_427745 [Lipomyces kononenkoae]|uniref:Uncharacterized protein n=1 Tax=Lipomyces kononenkoae TaxID=34357 RepID=A0ACC3SVM5_LIPKO